MLDLAKLYERHQYLLDVADEAAGHETVDSSTVCNFLDAEDAEEYKELNNFIETLDQYGNGRNTTLLDSDDLQQHARELFADSVEALPEFIRSAIDWEQVAKDVATDYTVVSYEGNDYYIV